MSSLPHSKDEKIDARIDSQADNLANQLADVGDFAESPPSIAPPPIASSEAKTDERYSIAPRDVRMILISLMLTMFMAALDQTIVASAMPTIGRDLNNVVDLSWVVSGYLLASTAVAPVFGSLSDIYGRRIMLITAISVFLAGSLVCALAPTMSWLIAGRLLQGMGGGGIIPLVQTTVSDVIPPRDRAKYQGYFSMVWTSAGLGGPVLGGFIAEYLHWTFIFWLNIPLVAIAAAMLIPNMKKIPVNIRPRRVDILGGAMLMAAAVSIMLALTWGGKTYAWMSPTIIAMIGAAVCLAFSFVWHARRTEDPFIPISLLSGKVVPYTITAISCVIGAMISLTVNMPLYYQVTYGLDASAAGLCLIPLAVGSVPGAVMAGQVMGRFRRYKWITILGLSIAAVATMLIAIVTPLPLWALVLMQTVAAVGMGTTFPMALVSSQNAVPRHQVGTMTGTQNFARALASTFLVAVFAAILLAGFGGEGQLKSAELLHRLTPAIVVDAYRWVFALAAVLFAIGAIAIALMEERPLAGKGIGKQAA